MFPKENFVLILGAGITGLSAINYLKGKKNFKIFDTRNIHKLPKDFINDESIKTNLISLKDLKFELIEYVICSPGFDYDHEIIKLLKKNNISIKSDIEIFVEENNSKKILVSGTNGKTTIVDLLYNLFHLPSKKSLVLILAIFFCMLNNELANWQTTIFVSSFLVTAIIMSAFSAPAFSKTEGNVALPTIPLTS